jgi:hypothetical protein
MLPLTGDGRLQNRKPLSSADDVTESPLSGWHANLIKLQRRHCLLFVHDTTRFPVFIPALTKPYLAELDRHFVDSFMNALVNAGVDDDLTNKAHRALGAFVCDCSCDRSVQGTLNQMAQELGYVLHYRGCAVADMVADGSADRQLAESPRMVKGRKDPLWPIEAMMELLRDSDL